MIWKDKYDSVGYFINGFAKVIKIIDGENKWGFVNTEGKEVVPCVYDWIGAFKNGFAEVMKIIDGKAKFGFINIEAKEVVPCVYDSDYVEQALNDYIKKKSIEEFLDNN